MANLKSVQTDAISLDIYEACSRRAMAEPRREYLGMSAIGKPCERSLWLQCHGAEQDPLDGQLARRFDCGHATEARVIADFRAAGYTITGEQLEFSDFDGRFRGHCDGIIHGLSKSHPERILEIKSANDANFKMFQKNGVKFKPAYAAQLQCYMGYGGYERTLFVVENKNNQAIYTERICFDREYFEAIRAKAIRVLDAKEPPEKIEDESECRYACSYNLACASPPETQSSPPKEPDGPGCAGCLWFHPESSSAEASRDMVSTLRFCIKSLAGLDLIKLESKRQECMTMIQESMAGRPDLNIPLEAFTRGRNFREHLTGALEHVLSLDTGWVITSAHLLHEDPDILTCHYNPAAADGDWCGNPKHKARIYNPVGCECPDWIDEVVPF